MCLDVKKALIPLAKDDENFDDAPPALFGTEFAKKAKDYVDQVKALRSSNKDRRPFLQGGPQQQGGLQLQDQRRKRWWQPQLVLPPSERWRPKQLEPQFSERRRPVTSRDWTQEQRLSKVSFNECFNQYIESHSGFGRSSHNALARRLAHHIQNWVRITRDRWVLDTVQGYFLTIPYQTEATHPALQRNPEPANNRRSQRTSAQQPEEVPKV